MCKARPVLLCLCRGGLSARSTYHSRADDPDWDSRDYVLAHVWLVTAQRCSHPSRALPCLEHLGTSAQRGFAGILGTWLNYLLLSMTASQQGPHLEGARGRDPPRPPSFPAQGPSLPPWMEGAALALPYLDVPCPLVGLVGHFLLHAGQLLLQVGHFVLVQLGEVVQLLFQALVPMHGGWRDGGVGRCPCAPPLMLGRGGGMVGWAGAPVHPA